MPIAVPTSIQITPLDHSAGFGAEVRGIDLNHLDEETFKKLEEAVYVHKLLVIRDQKDLDPAKQYELVQRFDPVQAGKDGNAKSIFFQGKQNFNSAPCVPGAPQVRLVGVGEFPPGHYGTTEHISLDLNSHRGFHNEPLTEEEMAAGDTRFQRWHLDAQFYGEKEFPARVTALWIHTLPSKGNVNVRFDDGSGSVISAPPGRTAFIDAVKMYESFSDEDKAWVQHSTIEYAPSPFQWMSGCKALGNGFGLVSEGAEVPIENLPSADPAKIQTLPMLWPNPVTGEMAFMVHATIARKLFIKHSADGPVEVIDDIAAVRQKLYDVQRPFLQEKNIIFSPQEEGDMALWFNRGLRHSAVDLHKSWAPRLVHQCQITGSDNPAFPEPIPRLPCTAKA